MTATNVSSDFPDLPDPLPWEAMPETPEPVTPWEAMPDLPDPLPWKAMPETPEPVTPW